MQSLHNRCKTGIRKAKHRELQYYLGEVETNSELTKEQIEQLGNNLTALGFELLDNSKQQLIEKIKNTVIENVHYREEENNHNYSEILSKSLHKDYSYLSSLFSEVEGITIEKYIISQRIEKVKELIIYDVLSLSEIAYKLGIAVLHIFQTGLKKLPGLHRVILSKLEKTNVNLLIKFKHTNMRATTLIAFLSILTSVTFGQNIGSINKDIIVAKGKMPNITTDKRNNVYMVYGTGDSIMYLSSMNKGKTFSAPSLIAVLPGLFASAMRGPQIAATDNGLIVTACTNKGNIYSYRQTGIGKWTKAMKVNEVDEVAKEALMGLSADGLNVFAVWLAVKNPKGQNVYGARSIDGGKTWSKNLLVYASPDNTVCECCKPSVAVKGNNVFVMFRNWINGNRDLYLAKSGNGGKSFENAEKLGVGNWKLNGCPMDGGGLAINNNGIPQTVWRREGKIYAATMGSAEKEIGEGRGCTVETVNNKNIYAWTENGEVVLIKPQGQKKVLGKGSQPIVKALNNDHVICVWENDKQIHASIVEL